MKTFDVSRLPTMITLGYDGENNWRQNQFDCSSLLANHPNGTISLWLLPHGETQAFPVALTRDGDSVVWTPLSEEMTAATGALQLVCTDGTDVGKSAVVMFRVDESIFPGAEHPAAVPSWATNTIERAESAADRAEEAAESIDIEQIEQTIADAVEEYLREHPVDVPVQSVNGKTGAVSLDAEDVGALPSDTPIPSAVTEQDVANWGFTKNTGTYSKPSGGIPKTDLASDVQTSLEKADTALQTAPVTSVNNKTGGVTLGAADVHALPDSTVIPVVPQMATDINMSDWTSGKTVDAAVLAQDFATALAQLNELAAKVEEPVLEEILTITGDGTRPFITTDKNGEPFALKKMVVKAEITDSLSAAGNFSFHGMSSTTGIPTSLCSLYFSWSASATNRFKAEGVLWQENGFWRQTSYGFSNNGYGAINGTYAYDFALSTADYPAIRAVDSGSVVPAGITIKVYGIRA